MTIEEINEQIAMERSALRRQKSYLITKEENVVNQKEELKQTLKTLDLLAKIKVLIEEQE